MSDDRSPEALRIVPATFAVASVVLDGVEFGRARYKVTLTCGCSYWEHGSVTEQPVAPGEPVACYDNHHSAIARVRAARQHRS